MSNKWKSMDAAPTNGARIIVWGIYVSSLIPWELKFRKVVTWKKHCPFWGKLKEGWAENDRFLDKHHIVKGWQKFPELPIHKEGM